MQVNAFNPAAPSEGASIVTRTLSDPEPNQVQVKLLIAGVNPSGDLSELASQVCLMLASELVSKLNRVSYHCSAADVFSLMGVYPGFTTKLPGTPGFDGEGPAQPHCSTVQQQQLFR